MVEAAGPLNRRCRGPYVKAHETVSHHDKWGYEDKQATHLKHMQLTKVPPCCHCCHYCLRLRGVRSKDVPVEVCCKIKHAFSHLEPALVCTRDKVCRHIDKGSSPGILVILSEKLKVHVKQVVPHGYVRSACAMALESSMWPPFTSTFTFPFCLSPLSISYVSILSCALHFLAFSDHLDLATWLL